MKKPARMAAAALNRPAERLEGLNTYITGKMKRYYLLFAVKGGAFVIAKLALLDQGRCHRRGSKHTAL